MELEINVIYKEIARFRLFIIKYKNQEQGVKELNARAVSKLRFLQNISKYLNSTRNFMGTK